MGITVVDPEPVSFLDLGELGVMQFEMFLCHATLSLVAKGLQPGGGIRSDEVSPSIPKESHLPCSSTVLVCCNVFGLPRPPTTQGK